MSRPAGARFAHHTWLPCWRSSGGLILVFGVLIGGFSIGFFWAPAVVLIKVGALVAMLANFVITLRLKPLRHNS